MNARHTPAVFFILIFLFTAILAFPAPARAFDDVPQGAWYYEAVRYAAAGGVMNGVGENSFAPDGYVDRAMFVTMLYRLEGKPETAASCPFGDVAPGGWYEAGVTWAAANGIVSGYSDLSFRPGDRMSREQMAAVCYRYARYKGYDVSAKADLSSFADAAGAHDWAEDALGWSVAAGLMGGVGGNALAPQGPSTRAQAAAVLMRFEENIILQQAETVSLPVLTYHDVGSAASDMVITPKMLEKHFAALKRAGYHAILPSELRDYVYQGAPLPKKPLLITFDDGYLSNAKLALPLLKKYDLKAAVFIIGVSFGADTYKDTGIAISPHFGAAEAAKMLASSRVEFGSHTFDLHQWAPYEEGPEVRENLKKLPGDTRDKYMALVREDARRFAAFYAEAIGGSTDFFAYPSGVMTEEAAAVLREEGYTVTFGSERGVNTVVRGLPRSLTGLRRFSVSGDMTASRLLEMIGR